MNKKEATEIFNEKFIEKTRRKLVGEVFLGKKSYEDAKEEYAKSLASNIPYRVVKDTTPTILDTLNQFYHTVSISPKDLKSGPEVLRLVTTGVIINAEAAEHRVVYDEQTNKVYVYIHDFEHYFKYHTKTDRISKFKFIEDRTLYYIETVYSDNEQVTKEAVGFTSDLNNLLGHYWKKFISSGNMLYIQTDKESLDILIKNRKLTTSYTDYMNNTYSYSLIIKEVKENEFNSSTVEDQNEMELDAL